ncbi:DUF190 domain-containing protein [Legionella sp. W10-070]|uniref:DUF190 domain-containing protein n=1 Tax=unclassified Legionella TaxID=2622702 RepID=UPI001A93C89F|nr:DUF190 domain-containing protein [Legionella sp. W10-070]MDI9817824.1 DUF190 domain-containing protein [Legionella sp. PL877]
MRIYLSEDAPLLNEIYNFLHQQNIRGATIFRGVKGYGGSGKTRESTFLDMHFDLPMVLEFFDEAEKVEKILQHFSHQIEAGRILSWLAESL